MDNLTHSLAGAVLGQLGLKKKTGLGMATLIIAANIPDIDAVAVLLGGHVHLGIRRGITHGPIAMLVLPIILTGIMIWFDRWQEKRDKRPEDRLPIHKGWLLALAFIGTLSHPALDLMNNYGVRLLEPFSSQWYYGDTLFIIDIWIWAAAILGLWLSFRRERSGHGNWQRPAWISFTVICAYIFTNGVITGKAEAETAQLVQEKFAETPTLVVANPQPVLFWHREVLWRSNRYYGTRLYNFLDGDGGNFLTEAFDIYNAKEELPTNLGRNIERIRQSDDPSASAYLFWSRMPLVEDKGDHYIVTDQRFGSSLVSSRFSVQVPKDKPKTAKPSVLDK